MEKENKLFAINRALFILGVFFVFSFTIERRCFIDYNFPNEVNKELLNYITEQTKKDSSIEFFALITSIKDTVYLNLMVYESKSKSKLTDLINHTDRRINLKNRMIPVLSKIDFLYSSVLLKPNENGGVDDVLFGGGGFYLHFYSTIDKKGIILRKGVSP